MVKPRLETIANLVIIVAGLAVSTAYVRPLLTTPPTKANTVQTYAPGDRIRQNDKLSFSGSTFLLFSKSGCKFCDASMPLYKELISRGARLIAIAGEDVETNRSYLAQHGVKPETIVNLKDSGLRFEATPSLVLVNSDGRVLKTWWGKQDDKMEREIIGSIQ